jgi:hypothetical protein
MPWIIGNHPCGQQGCGVFILENIVGLFGKILRITNVLNNAAKWTAIVYGGMRGYY